MKNTKYSAGIVSQSFWFNEFRQYLKLIKSNYTSNEIKTKIIEENLFGAPNESRAKRIYGYISNRARQLDNKMIDLFFCSDLETQKLINLIAIIRNDRLFFEFLYEVYREKIIIGENTLEITDVKTFFNHKESQEESIEQWTDVTKRRTQSAYLTFMMEANLLRVDGKDRYITPPLLDITLEDYLKQDGESALVKAITGEY